MNRKKNTNKTNVRDTCLKKDFSKINIAMCANNLQINGISAVIMNYCKNIDLNKFNITLLVGTPIAEIYRDECSKKGISIVELPERKKRPLSYFSSLYRELHNNKFDIFHVHGNSATISIELLLAYFNHIQRRIAHGHSSTCDHIRIDKILRPLFRKLYTGCFACSSLAGKWLFKDDDFTIIPNGFYTNDFVFNQQSRSLIREKLGLQEKYILCNVGRFDYLKNHPFLLEVFFSIAQEREDAVLLLIGTGPDYEKIQQQAAQSLYADRIIFYGKSNNVPDILSAADVFLCPSIAEGLGIVVLEAQISGLPCVVSNRLPKEVVMGENIQFIPIEKNNILLWHDVICNLKIDTEKRGKFYEDNQEFVMKYDIRANVKILENEYIKMLD